MTMKWYGDKIEKDIHAEMARRLFRAAIVATKYIKRRLSRGQPVRIPASKAKYGKNPSRPGEYPKMVTSLLRTTVIYEVDAKELVARVGTNTLHGKYLELGTRRGLQRRPWLSRGITEKARTIRTILVEPMKK